MAEGTRKNPLEYQREYNEFMYKLKRFLASKDMPMKKLPQFGGQDIDLYLLYKTVTNFGGWVKVTDDNKWHEVAKNFNLPPSCLNSAFALRQLYVRYLEGYEKLYFLDEDGDDASSPKINLFNFGSHGSQQMPPVFQEHQRNFERLVLSLQSGLPNEVDFAINICMLLSNVNNSVFNLTKAPAVIDMILAHVGVFEEDSFGSSDLYKEWYKNSGKDFLKFWRRVLNCEEIKQLLPKPDEESISDVEEQDGNTLFNLEITATHQDYELQRVLQVCTILHNFSFDRMDASVLSSHPVCIRFLMFCLHCKIGSLKKLATDTITNLADKMVLEPLESLNSQLFFFMIDRYLRDSDRHNRICAMNVLRKICLQEQNQEFICTALDGEIYQALITILVLEDIQLLIPSLETLYQLTNLGQIPCDCIVAVEKSIEILVSILHLCVESFGTEMLSKVKIVDSYHGVAMVPTATAAKNSPNKLATTSEGEPEHVAQHWLRNAYDFDLSSTILQRDLYADYVASCGKVTRNVLNVPSFYRLLRSVYPEVQIVKVTAANQQMYGLVGLRRKLPPGQYFMQTSTHHASRTPGRTLPMRMPRSSSVNANIETTFTTSHATRHQTPATKTDSMSTPIPIHAQAPSLPGQFVGSSPQVRVNLANVQLPSRPTIGPVSKPSVMSASQFLGSLVDSKQSSSVPNCRLGNMQSNQLAPANFVSPSGVPAIDFVTSSQVTSTSYVTSSSTTSSTQVISSNIVSSSSQKMSSRHMTSSSQVTLPSDMMSVQQSSAPPKTVGLPSACTPVIGTRRGNEGNYNGSSDKCTVSQSSDFKKVMIQENVAKKVAVVNGTRRESSATKLPVVNGARTNGDIGLVYVGKEEQAIKMAPKGHEVVISVVENPQKETTETSEGIFPEGLVLGKKRPKSLLGDIPKEGDSALLMNGPFVASEMLRNVAKRQRIHSEGVPLVNGSSEQKGPMAWDDLVRAHPKPLVTSSNAPMMPTKSPVIKKLPTTSSKFPSAVNGMRLDVLNEHVEVPPSKSDAESIESSSNAGNFIPGGFSSSVTSQSCNAMITTSGIKATDTSTVGTSTPTDITPGNNLREDNNAGVSLPYACLWAGCKCSFTNTKLLYNHAVSVHAPKEQLFTSCQWEGCSNVRRSRASLLFHLRQRHLTPAAQLKDSNVVPKPQKVTLPVGPIPSPNAAQPTTAHGRAVLPPHPSVNPLLLNLKEQLLQTEHESPLTKSVRLTSALVLRNIAKHSPSGRRKMKRFESSFTEIMCSKLESNGAIAACLHEISRPRKEDLLPKR